MKLARIVIGLDLTNSSIQSAAWAAQSFAPEADVVLLHCVSPLLSEAHIADERQRAETYLSYLVTRIGPARCNYRVRLGDPARGLAELAAQEDADLIAVGAHEDHPDREPTLGSTAERLIRCSPVPVLLCAERRSGAPRSLLLPLQSAEIRTSVAEWTEALAARFDARVVLVHVQVPHEDDGLTTHARKDDLEVMESSMPWTDVAHDLPPDHVFVDAVLGEPADAVLAEARRFDSDLVLLPAPAETGANGATPVDRVLRASACAVLVVPPLEHPPIH